MLRQYRDIRHGEFIVIGCDTSMGLGDYSTAQFISKNRQDVPMVYQSKSIATEMTNELYPLLEKIYDITEVKPIIAYERNNGGVFEMERLASMNRLSKYKPFVMPRFGRENNNSGDLLGWDTNTATRPMMLQTLKEYVDNKILTIYDKQTIEEMFSFIIVNTSSSVKAQAEKCCHDDLVMSLAIALQVYQMTPMIQVKNDEYQDFGNIEEHRSRRAY